jgi:hypothetical protein
LLCPNRDSRSLALAEPNNAQLIDYDILPHVDSEVKNVSATSEDWPTSEKERSDFE